MAPRESCIWLFLPSTLSRADLRGQENTTEAMFCGFRGWAVKAFCSFCLVSWVCTPPASRPPYCEDTQAHLSVEACVCVWGRLMAALAASANLLAAWAAHVQAGPPAPVRPSGDRVLTAIHLQSPKKTQDKTA